MGVRGSVRHFFSENKRVMSNGSTRSSLLEGMKAGERWKSCLRKKEYMEASTDVDGSYLRDVWNITCHGLSLHLHGRFRLEASTRLPFNFQNFHFDFQNHLKVKMEVLEVKMGVLKVKLELLEVKMEVLEVFEVKYNFWKSNGSFHRFTK